MRHITLPRFRIHFKGVMNTNGKELDSATYIPINQFRELFAQKINPEGCYSPDDSFIVKDKPLFQNYVSPVKKRDHANWMNTPLKKKQ